MDWYTRNLFSTPTRLTIGLIGDLLPHSSYNVYNFSIEDKTKTNKNHAQKQIGHFFVFKVMENYRYTHTHILIRKNYTKISESLPWEVHKLSIFSSFINPMKLQDKRTPSNNPCIIRVNIESRSALIEINKKKLNQNYQIHEAKNPFRQRSPKPKTFQSSTNQKMIEKIKLNNSSETYRNGLKKKENRIKKREI